MLNGINFNRISVLLYLSFAHAETTWWLGGKGQHIDKGVYWTLGF